jgi:hypothetical protein
MRSTTRKGRSEAQKGEWVQPDGIGGLYGTENGVKARASPDATAFYTRKSNESESL